MESNSAMSKDSLALTQYCWTANRSMEGLCSRRRPKDITSSQLKGWASILSKVGEKRKVYTLCKKLLSSLARSNAATARPPKSSRQKLCLIKIQTQAKNKSGMQLRECSVAAQVISSQYKLC